MANPIQIIADYYADKLAHHAITINERISIYSPDTRIINITARDGTDYYLTIGHKTTYTTHHLIKTDQQPSLHLIKFNIHPNSQFNISQVICDIPLATPNAIEQLDEIIQTKIINNIALFI